MKDTTQLVTQLKQLLAILRRHMVLLVIVGFAALCAYILMLTARLSTAEPTTEVIEQQTQTTLGTKVDPLTVDTILGLEDQNIQVRSIFEEARENPFTE